MTDVIHDAIVEGMARAIWVFAYVMSQLRNEAEPVDALDDVHFDKWDDYIGDHQTPPIRPRHTWSKLPTWLESTHSTPPSAFTAATSLARLIASDNQREYGAMTSVVTLFEAAQIADVGSDEMDVKVAGVFGYYLVAMALDQLPDRSAQNNLGDPRYLYLSPTTGVSWWNEHQEFRLSVPSMLVAFINGTLSIRVYANSGKAFEDAPTSEWGADPRVVLRSTNPEDDEEVMLIEDFHKKSQLQIFHSVIEAAVDFGVQVQATGEQVLAPLGDGFALMAGRRENGRLVGVEGSPVAWTITPESLDPLVTTAVRYALTDTFDLGRRNEGRAYDITWGRLHYANFNDHNFHDQMFVLWFGGDGISARYVVVFANHLEDALEEGIDYVAENYPGLLANEQIVEEYNRLRQEFVDEHEREPDDEEEMALQEEAEVDTTTDGQGNAIMSDHWGISMENPSLQDLVDFVNRY